MTITEMLTTLNNGRLELHTHPYPKNAVSYDSLFTDDYVVAVYTGDDLLQLVYRAYSSKPSWLEFTEAVAKTADGNYWFYKESACTNHRPLWWWNGQANNKLKEVF